MNDTTSYRFRVSDVAHVPLRGMLLRLKLLAGEPDAKRLRKGGRLRLHGPDGVERTVSIAGTASTGGRPTQKRLDATGEVDIVIAAEEALEDGVPVAIGWEASGPVS